MAHSIIIQLSTEKLPKEDWWIDDEDYPTQYIDYVGEQFTDHERRKALNNHKFWTDLTIDVQNETLAIPNRDDFNVKYIEEIRKVLDDYEGGEAFSWNIRNVVNRMYDNFLYYINGKYYTLPVLVEYFSGETLHICGLYDYHF